MPHIEITGVAHYNIAFQYRFAACCRYASNTQSRFAAYISPFPFGPFSAALLLA